MFHSLTASKPKLKSGLLSQIMIIQIPSQAIRKLNSALHWLLLITKLKQLNQISLSGLPLGVSWVLLDRMSGPTDGGWQTHLSVQSLGPEGTKLKVLLLLLCSQTTLCLWRYESRIPTVHFFYKHKCYSISTGNSSINIGKYPPLLCTSIMNTVSFFSKRVNSH